MARKVMKDESGVAMGLTVMMILLIGVMGAGLLAFVRTDLDSVIEENKGQKALDIADAGVEAAKEHLLTQDATRQHFDLTHLNDCAAGQRLSNEDWSPATTVYVNPNCTGATTTRSTPGVTKAFAGGTLTVTIRCYSQEPVADCLGVTENAPEAIPASSKAFFKITSTGEYGGAKRKIEAIYFASRSLDVPIAYFANQGNIDIQASDISGVSFFTGNGNIIISNQRKANLDRLTPALYGDWRLNPYNTQRRESAAGVPSIGVGLGANGWICTSANNCASNADSTADGVHDYDRSTAVRGVPERSNKSFFRKTSPTAPQSAGQITFPFDPNESPPIDLLREEARRQGNYYRMDQLPNGNMITNAIWPASSNERTVFFVDAGNITTPVDYRVNVIPRAQGLLVVTNGNLEISSSSGGLSGLAIVTGDGSLTGTYTSAGGAGGLATISGFVYSSGSQTLRGSVNPSPSRSFTNTPGFYGVRLWSWRELYS